MAIVDLVAELTEAQLGAPATLHARDVTARVIELYWPQTTPYGAPAGAAPTVLSQSPQNDILTTLAFWRSVHGLKLGASLSDAERVDPGGWADLVADLNAVVVAVPLAKIQKFGEGRTAIDEMS